MLAVSLEQPESPLVEGMPCTLSLSVRAEESTAALLEDAFFEGGRARVEWKKRPRGVISYDATADRYLHATGLLARSAVPLSSGALPASHGSETLIAARALEPGRARLALVVRYREVPRSELPSRLYLPPDRGIEGTNVRYERLRAGDLRGTEAAPGVAITRETDLPLLEARVELEVAVVEDAASPGGKARERGRLLGRSRALGHAWVVEPRPGELEVLLGDGPLALGGRVDLSVLDLADGEPPGSRLALTLIGERAGRVGRGLPLERASSGVLLPREVLGKLLEATREGVRLRAGLPWEGIVVEDDHG
ncbi:hypothetical protein HY251_04130 [bacterium]|nr:hypothetical protein [bacterium]